MYFIVLYSRTPLVFSILVQRHGQRAEERQQEEALSVHAEPREVQAHVVAKVFADLIERLGTRKGVKGAATLYPRS